MRWRDEDASSALFGADGSALGDRFRFTARELDGAEALPYSRARHYDPTPGRWRNDEAIGFAPGDEQVYPNPCPAASSSAGSAGNR